MKKALQTAIGLLIVIVSLLGFLDASYITWNDVRGIVPPCRPPFACDTVLKSSWSHIGPLPLSVLGMFYYALIFFIGTLHFLEVESRRSRAQLAILTVAGFGFSLYLLFLMGFILHAWCLYCLLSATSSSTLFVLGFFNYYLHREGKMALRHEIFSLLYIAIAKPIFFLFDAEFVHISMVRLGRWLGMSAPTRWFTQHIFAYAHPKLQKKIDGVLFPNPVGLSAGFDYNADLTDILPSVGFGFMTIGTITREPYAGNTKPRLGRLPRSQALLVNKGFKNIGAKAIIAKLANKQFAIPVGISIGSTNKRHASLSAQIDDVVDCFYLFEKSKVSHAYYELNISCPNTVGGQPFTTPDRLERLLSRLDKLRIQRPIYIKMPIDMNDEDTVALLRVASLHGIAGVIFGNLTKDKENMMVHPEDRKVWKQMAGNLSGKPTQARSNHMIALTKKKFKSRFTIIGTGGIFTPEDAKVKLRLGAHVVQLITGMIYEGPQLIGAINRSMMES